jgi:signal transduction histidine kinase
LLIRPFGLQGYADYTLKGDFDADGAFRGSFEINRGDKAKQKLTLPAEAISPEQASCGSFSVHINIYDREPDAIKALFERMGANFDKVGILNARRILTENAGISIFRKGFRIRPYGEPENDWLELERQRVQDPSKKLGISQVSGVVEIADESVSKLVERSSREGLEHNGAYERLKSLIQKILIHAEERRFQFREKAGLSRKVKGDLTKVRASATLRRVVNAAKLLPTKYRRRIETAAQRDAAALAAEIQEIGEYQQALQSRAALGLVVAEVLHEGRRLLNPVATSAKLLLDNKDWLLEESKRGIVFRRQFPEHVETIYTNTRDLGRLFKKLDPISGRKRGKPRNFNISEVITRCLELFREPIGQNSIKIHTECDSTLHAYGYDDDLQAALMNIIDNAIHWLSTSSGKRKLDISCGKEVRCALVKVSNNGPIIDDMYLPRLFEVGFTLKSGGTGLGLAISREAMRRSKGEIIYDHNASETTFIIRMPLKAN